MVADLVREVGGPHVRVQQLMGAGVDPHLYKVTRDDVRSILQSDIVFYSGLMLEGKMAATLEKIGRQKPVVAITQRLPKTELLEPDDAAGHFDPHVWMDVRAWEKGVPVVADALAQLDPAHRDEYFQRAASYQQQLIELDEYARRTIGSIPPEQRILITSHDAFNYFGRAYGLDVRGIQGLSTESEGGLKQVNALVDLMVDRGIQAVFIESSVPRKNIDALIEGARSRGHEVAIGGELFSDAMGEPGTYEGTYVGMIDHNVTLTARALGGEAPPRGMAGRLDEER
jgi:manganese/zinc/iron transport system substrate-binding protein